MSRKRLMIGWTMLMVALAVGGCGPASVPADEEPAFGPAWARDAAMATTWAEGEPMPALDWSEEDLTPQDRVGSSTMRYTADEWIVTVTYPIVAPDATIYQVSIVNTTSGLTWSGEVDAQGNVSEVASGSADMPNPASAYCEEQGGTLEIRRGEGGEYGVCVFEDNRQCEEWAMLRGECPVGGIKITGYVTLAAQYCAITGGEYQVTGNSNTDQEQGTCTFKNGQTCDAWDYFVGKCDSSAEAGQSSYDDPFAYCAAVGTIDAPDGRYDGVKMPDSIIQGMIQQGIVSADAPLEFQQNAVWRCMNNSVWVCHFGANLPCQEKADTAQVPTSEMEDYCGANPTADFIPAAVTGRATVYEWGCKDGKPEVVKQLFKSDPQGYLADFWHELTPQ
jgi:putative hemolysin